MTGSINVHGSTGVDLKRIEAIANDAKKAAANVTKDQLGIENVDNTSDADKPVSTAQQAALNKKADASSLTSHENDSEKHITSAERAAWNKKADASELSSHQNDTVKHITSAERAKWNGKAEASHNHSAGNITSGTLPIARGGTGNTTGLAASATKLATGRTIRTNLSSTGSASFDGTANIAPGVTGTLPISNGGTGASTAANARSNLGAFSSSGGTISGAVYITGAVDIQNNTVHIGNGNSGAKINLGDSDYVHIYENADDNLEIKAKNINFVTSGSLTNNGGKIGGGDFIFTTSAPSSLSSGQVAFVYV